MDADNHEMPANRTLKHLFYLQNPTLNSVAKYQQICLLLRRKKASLLTKLN